MMTSKNKGPHQGRGSLLLNAAYHGQVSTVASLIQRGFSLNVRDFQGRTPLHQAVLNTDLPPAVAAAVVLELRKAGARDDLPDGEGRTVHEWATALLVWPAVVEALTAPIDALSMLNTAVSQQNNSRSRGFDQRIREALRQGANPWDASPNGLSVIVTAVMLDRHLAVWRFAAYGVKVTSKEVYNGAEGWTLLHHAALHGALITTYALLSAGADPNALNDKGNSPLHYATNTVGMALLNAGADPHLPNREGQTPMRAFTELANDPQSSPQQRAQGQELVQRVVDLDAQALRAVMDDLSIPSLSTALLTPVDPLRPPRRRL